jgi:hypothetical protein
MNVKNDKTYFRFTKIGLQYFTYLTASYSANQLYRIESMESFPNVQYWSVMDMEQGTTMSRTIHITFTAFNIHPIMNHSISIPEEIFKESLEFLPDTEMTRLLYG